MTLGLALVRKRRDLGRPLENSQRTWGEREWLQVSLRDDEGHVGVGEAAPLPGYSDESLPEAERAVVEWASARLGPVEALVERIATKPRGLRESLSSLGSIRVPSARFALETALLHLLAGKRRETLYDQLKRLCAVTTPEPLPGLPLAQLISLHSADAEAGAALENGFTTLKLKIGTPIGFAAELATLSRLRARFGNGFALRLDGNQGFSSEGARDALIALQPLGIEFVEEPLAVGEPPLEKPAIPVALDESLRRSPSLAPDELARRGVRALILKPSVLGGFSATLELVERAKQLGLDWVLSHTFESSVGYRALAAFALALGPAPLAHGLGPHAALDCDPETLGVHAGKLWALDREAA